MIYLVVNNSIGTSYVLIDKNHIFVSKDGSSDNLPSAIAVFCQRCSYALSDIQHVFVVKGPGSITGTKIALTFAKACGFYSTINSAEVILADIYSRYNNIDSVAIRIPYNYSQMFCYNYQTTLQEQLTEHSSLKSSINKTQVDVVQRNHTTCSLTVSCLDLVAISLYLQRWVM